MRLPRISAETYRRITLVAAIALAAIIVTGAAVRLTESGLGCVDWPTCSKHELVAQSGFHPMVEQLNRYFTGLISVAVAIAVLGALARVPRRNDLVWWSLGLVAGLVADIVLGGIVVLTSLWPPLVAAHFLLSAAILWDAVVLHHRAGHDGSAGVLTVAPAVRTMAAVLIAAASVVLLTGTIVTGTGPHAGDQHASRLPFLLEDVARIHSLTVWTFLALTVATLAVLVRTGATPIARRRLGVLVALIVAQGAVGYAQYFMGVPPGLVMIHIVGAVAVWVATIQLFLDLYARPAEGHVGAASTTPASVDVGLAVPPAR